MPQQLVARPAQQTTNTLTARGFAWAALVVVVYLPPLVPPAGPALAAVSVYKGLVLLFGKVVLGSHVRQSTSL